MKSILITRTLSSGNAIPEHSLKSKVSFHQEMNIIKMILVKWENMTFQVPFPDFVNVIVQCLTSDSKCVCKLVKEFCC